MPLSTRWSLLTTNLLVTILLLTRHVAAQAAPSDLPNLSSLAAASSISGATTATDADSSTITSAPSGTSVVDLPSLSTSSYDGIVSAPRLSGAYSYPAPTVPPTANAPFMQKSSLPEGFVFICVGAVLGFSGMIFLAWRGLVAWSLHRSVRRAANGKLRKRRGRGSDLHQSLFRNAGTPYYHKSHGSNLSLEPLAPQSRGGSKPQTPRSSLFFSPTAGVGVTAPASSNTSYLPAGYYAPGTSAAANGVSSTQIGGGDARLSQVDINTQSQRHGRAHSMDPSWQRSPSLPPSRGTNNMPGGRHSYIGLSTQPSTSIVNLREPVQGTAPSDYLDELFENHPPGAICQD